MIEFRLKVNKRKTFLPFLSDFNQLQIYFMLHDNSSPYQRSKMNTSTIVVAFLMIGLLVTPSRAWPDWWDRTREAVRAGRDRTREAFQGAGDMLGAYNDMRDANYRNSDKYFHARGNYDAAQRGPGGAWAAGVISDARENWQGGVSGRGFEDTRADQEANRWGRNGGNPNRYRPAGLPDRY